MPLCDVPAHILAESRQRWYAALGYTPKLGQRLMDEAVDAGKRTIGYFTPPQDGKSYHIAKHVGPYMLFPETHGWIVAPKYEDGAKEFGYLRQDLAQMGLLKRAVRNYFDIRGGNMHIELRNRSWVQVVTVADGTDNLRKEQLDFVIFAEASKMAVNPYPTMYSRVEKRRGKVFYPSTHKGYGWMYQDVRVPSLPFKDKTFEYGAWEGNRRPMVGGEQNPLYDADAWSVQVSYVPEFGDVLHTGEFTPEQIAKARLKLPAPMFAEQFGGEAASYSGLVYAFNRIIHKRPRFAIPRHWTHVVGYDHGAGGGSDPTAIEVGSYGPDGTLYWWGELYDHTQSTIQSRGSRLKVLLNGRVPAYIMTGRDSKQVITELREVGLYASCPADWSVEARIIRTSELIGLKRWVILEGCCPHLEREIGQYEWDEKNPGKPKDGNDHCLEAAGYGVLAPVALPDASLDTAHDETPEERGERFRRERLWNGWREEQAQEEVSTEARRFDRLLEPAGVVGDYVAR